MQAILKHITAQGDVATRDLWLKDIQQGLIQHLCEDDSLNQAKQATKIVLMQRMQEEIEQTLISAISYSGMETRQQTVAKSYANTFDWALQTHTTKLQKWDSFTNWLESNDQIYWITGKPGSGKSTLVKYLSQSKGDACSTNSRCYPFLRRWAGERDLMVVPFYFWASDNAELQKSRGGLLRTLLHLILCAKPWLVPIAFPLEWESLSLTGSFYPLPMWSEEHLMKSLLQILSALGEKDTCICFYIDGLDEFEGEPQLAITLVEQLAASGRHVKLCAASRPWNEFQEAFRLCPKLRLEDLTRDDIRLFVSKKLKNHPQFANLAIRDKSFANGIVDKIVDKASGVFLWVALVVNSLLSGLSTGDRIQDLEQAIDDLPAGLRELYERLLLSLPKQYRANRAEMIMLIEASQGILPLLVFAFADEQNLVSLTSFREKVMVDGAIAVHKHTAYLRLCDRWRGLLEVNSMSLDDRLTEADLNELEDTTLELDLKELEDGTLESDSESEPEPEPDPTADQPVQYLHKTVREFVQSADQISALKSALPADFDAHFQLCIGYCVAMKVKKPPIELRYTFCDNLVLRLLHHASLVADHNQLDVVKIIDQIPRSMFYNSYRANAFAVTGAQAKTSKFIEGHKQPDDIVDGLILLATRHGIVAYLERKLGHNQSTQRYSALLNEVEGITLPQAATIRWLLERGADPNYHQSSLTLRPWARIMRRCWGVHSLSRLSPAIRESVTAFVAYGADLRMVRPPKPRPFVTAVEQIRWRQNLYNELEAIPKIARPKTVLESVSSYMSTWMFNEDKLWKEFETGFWPVDPATLWTLGSRARPNSLIAQGSRVESWSPKQ